MRDGSLQAATTTHQSHSAGMPARLQKRLDDTHGGRSAEQGSSFWQSLTSVMSPVCRRAHGDLGMSARESQHRSSHCNFYRPELRMLPSWVQGVYTHADVAAAPRLEDLVERNALSQPGPTSERKRLLAPRLAY